MSASPEARVQRPDPSGESDSPFVLYVEGPRDREILRAWAWRLSPALSRAVGNRTVILGGRRPERAREHFSRTFGAENDRARALCVLDRDTEPSGAPASGDLSRESNALEFFTWGRRHIESYLLVPEAILRCVGLPANERRSHRVLARCLPDPSDEAALRALHAKSLFGRTGILSRALGRPVSPGRLAREMDRAELHPDVLALLARVAGRLREPDPSSSGERLAIGAAEDRVRCL